MPDLQFACAAQPQPRALDLREQCQAPLLPLPDLNRELQISVGSAHLRENVRIEGRIKSMLYILRDEMSETVTK